MSNDIGNIIKREFLEKTGRHAPQSEVSSWVNSLQYMDRVLSDAGIPSDAGIAIEYHIPRSSMRVDFIVTGADSARKDSVVLIELKQWSSAVASEKDGVVITRFQRGETETPHPSYQAWSYKCLLEDYNLAVRDEQILLTPCAYLHNYSRDGVIDSPFYSQYLDAAPIFFKTDAEKLQAFIRTHIKHGDKNSLLYRIDHGRIKPSKNLADSLASMLAGNAEFLMVDDQKVVYETALQLASRSSSKKKKCLSLRGGRVRESLSWP